MKRILVSVLVILMLLSLSLPSLGSIGLGTRAMGMGGAFTAVADDESAFYWNPAGITQVRFVSVMIGVGAQGEDFDFIMDTVDNISDQKELKPEDFEKGFGFFNLGLICGVTTRYVGVNFYSVTSGFAENVTGSDLYVELNNFTYGTVTLAGNFGEKTSIGLNVKRVVAGIGYGEVNPAEVVNETVYIDGDGLAYDVGVLYRLSDQVRFGFMVRNLGKDIKLKGKSYDYIADVEDVIDGVTIELPKDYAVGVSYRPFKNTLLAFDVQRADTYDETKFRIGFEQTALWNIIALRLGAYTIKDEPLALTAGLGFKLGPLAIGVAAVQEEINDKEATEGIVTAGIRF
ncbi:MAG: OmpP1/FadL family transporter [Bacteroidota bacterium]